MRWLLLCALLVAATGSACPADFTVRNGTGMNGKSTVELAKVANVASAEACCALCAARAECAGFTWHDATANSPEVHQCSMIRGGANAHDSIGAFSATREAAAVPPTPNPAINPQPLPALGFQPSIVFILTDDQDVEHGGLEPMPKARKLLGGAGATSRSFYVNTPVCCPSRSEYLSGRYHHNIRQGSYEGSQGCGDEEVNSSHPCGCMRIDSMGDAFESKTFANYVQEAGYTTAYVGKFLNPPAMDVYCQDDGKRIPGWDTMMGMCRTAYYNVTWAQDGYLNRTGDKPDEYTTSIIGNRSVAFIRDHGAAARSGAAPFLLMAATRAPHFPQTPAPWYSGAFLDEVNRVTPAFNYSARERGAPPTRVDQWPLAPLSKKEAAVYDGYFRDRWRTLLSVDDLVEAVVAELEAQQLLSKTYVFFSSDHGFHMGHMRLGFGKCHHYEFDTRVPMMVRGPLIAANSTASFLAGNVDIAPTFVELSGWTDGTGGRRPPLMDGRSMLPQLLGAAGGDERDERLGAWAPWRSMYLNEYTGLLGWGSGMAPDGRKRLNDPPNNTYRALRYRNAAGDPGMLYAEFTTVSDWGFEAVDFRELYDLSRDPYQLENLWSNASADVRAKHIADMNATWGCKGSACP